MTQCDGEWVWHGEMCVIVGENQSLCHCVCKCVSVCVSQISLHQTLMISEDKPSSQREARDFLRCCFQGGKLNVWAVLNVTWTLSSVFCSAARSVWSGFRPPGWKEIKQGLFQWTVSKVRTFDGVRGCWSFEEVAVFHPLVSLLSSLLCGVSLSVLAADSEGEQDDPPSEHSQTFELRWASGAPFPFPPLMWWISLCIDNMEQESEIV